MLKVHLLYYPISWQIHVGDLFFSHSMVWDLIFVGYFFGRLSLKYHPDKNKENGAQEKFSEINNGIVAYFRHPIVFVYFIIC